MSAVRIPALLVAAVVLLPPGLRGQQQPPQEGQQQAGEEEPVELHSLREVFTYPQYDRRNPFTPLVATAGGPRFEQMQLRGIIYADDPSESVALMGLTGTEQAQAAIGGTTQRLRIGESWGNVRILDIRATEIVVEVEEFGLTEQRVMQLPSRGQGGS